MDVRGVDVNFRTFAGEEYQNHISVSKGEGCPNFGHFVVMKQLNIPIVVSQTLSKMCPIDIKKGIHC